MGRRTSDPKWSPAATASRVRTILDRINRTPAEFAVLLGISRQAMYNWTAGASSPGPAMRTALERLEGKLNIH